MLAFSSRLIAAGAVACFIGAIALTPSEVRSRLSPKLDVAAATPSAFAPEPAIVMPGGDPFAARIIEADPTPMAAPHAPNPGSLPAFSLAHIGPLPANAGAGMMTLGPSFTGLRVSAVVIGVHPTAIIVDGTVSRLVTVGDRVGDARVTTIDASGIDLSDGRRLALPSFGMRP